MRTVFLSLCAMMLMCASALAQSNVYPVTVNYNLSIELLIKAGNYDLRHPIITDANFPSVRSGEAKIEIVLVEFNRHVSYKSALAELNKQGLRPADLKELLAFGAKYPEEQYGLPILALGSPWKSLRYYGTRYVSCLTYESPAQRSLDLCLTSAIDTRFFRFAAVRK